MENSFYRAAKLNENCLIGRYATHKLNTLKWILVLGTKLTKQFSWVACNCCHVYLQKKWQVLISLMQCFYSTWASKNCSKHETHLFLGFQKRQNPCVVQKPPVRIIPRMKIASKNHSTHEFCLVIFVRIGERVSQWSFFPLLTESVLEYTFLALMCCIKACGWLAFFYIGFIFVERSLWEKKEILLVPIVSTHSLTHLG